MANEFYITAGLIAIDSAENPASNAFYMTAGLVANDYVAVGGEHYTEDISHDGEWNTMTTATLTQKCTFYELISHS